MSKIEQLAKELPKVKWIAMGVCPQCGKEVMRDEDCTHAVCTCSSVVVVKLTSVIVLPDKLNAYFEALCKRHHISFDDLIELWYEVGLLNLEKALKKRAVALQVIKKKFEEVKSVA
jgi:DNA-directed RNA polymerase subunit RPC12/RpoP